MKADPNDKLQASSSSSPDVSPPVGYAEEADAAEKSAILLLQPSLTTEEKAKLRASSQEAVAYFRSRLAGNET